MNIESIYVLYSYKGTTLRKDYRERSEDVLSKYGLKLSEGSAFYGKWSLGVDNIMSRKLPYRRVYVTVDFTISIDDKRRIVYECFGESCDLFNSQKDIDEINTSRCYSLDDRKTLCRLWKEWMNAITIKEVIPDLLKTRVRINDGVLSAEPYKDKMYMDFSGFTGYVYANAWKPEYDSACVFWDDESLGKLPKDYIASLERENSDETSYWFLKKEFQQISEPDMLLWHNT